MSNPRMIMRSIDSVDTDPAVKEFLKELFLAEIASEVEGASAYKARFQKLVSKHSANWTSNESGQN